MTSTLTREEVQLHTGTAPEDHAHIILTREYLPGEPIEALCGYRFVPNRSPLELPVCPACVAVFEDNEARAMAAGYSSLPGVGGNPA